MEVTTVASATAATATGGSGGGAAAATGGGFDIQHSRRRWGVLAILCVAVFMLLLDGTIVNIAITSIMKAFNASFSEVEWVMNAYLLTFAVLLITTGRLGDLFGRRKVFNIGLCVFTLASLACGLSPGIGWLICFRAIQGVGGAMMMPNTLSIISNSFTSNERGKALGFWGGVTGISLAVGPSLGGVLVDGASWHWIFFINVPIGVILLGLSLKFVPESTDPTSVKQMDLPGVAVLTAALLALTFALIEGQTYGWTSALILGLFGVTVVGLALFILVQRRQVQPLMQLSMFRSRTFTVTNILGLILQFGMMGVFFLLPVFLQAVLGYSAIRAGLAMTPLAAMVIIAAPIAGTLSDRVGPRWLMFAGMVITAIGFFLTMRAMVVGATWQSLVLPFAVSGFGIALVMPPSTSAVMGAVAREKAGQASGVLTTMRQVGAVLGIAVMGAVLQNRAVTYIRDGVSAKLDSSPVQLPAGTKQSILDSINSSAINMGQLRTGGGFNASMPSSATKVLSGLPESVASQLVSFFKSLFSLDFIMGEFSRAMRTTYVFSIILMVLGAVLALFVRNRLKQPEAKQDAPEEESARAE